MWIQNVALSDIKRGFHMDPGENAMLIQIVDPDMEFPEPKHSFKHVAQFQFLDIEEDGLTNVGDGKMIDLSEFAITQEQANSLVMLLKQAYANQMNVLVHCHAGVCRSGAVCEVGVMMGFDDTEVFRSPNLLVKHKMMHALGWGYGDADE